jgi:hypothetical protein
MNQRDMKNTRKHAVSLIGALEAQSKKLEANLKLAKAHLKELDAMIADSTKLAAAAKKAPKAAKSVKKAEKPAKAAKAVKVKAKAEKPAKAVKAKSVKAAPKAAKAAPKAAKGERPTLVEGIRRVLGTKTMNAEAVLAALEEKGWAPNAKDKKGYTAYLLSSNKEDFARVPEKGRGFYKRIERADETKAPAAPKAEVKAETKVEAKAEAKAEVKAEPKVEAKAAKPAKKDKDDAKILEDLGVTSPAATNPFTS